ncbi:Ig-like domain-containing protein [Arthrobacter monumenti]
MKARTMLALMALLVGLVTLDLPDFSTAAFTSSSTNTGTVRAAADWTPPTVSMINPGSPVKGIVTVTANASDSETGIASVTIQYLAADGASWVTLCTTTVPPYSCSWDTKTVADGGYSLRAIATDKANYTTTSEALSTTVANNFMVTLSNPGEFARGSVTLTASLVNAGLAVYTTRIEYAVAGTGQWKTLCSNLLPPYNCTWNTAGFVNDYYDLRAAATANGTTTYSAIINDVLVDNASPSVTMTDPGTPLSGFRTFAATATDAHSDVAQVTIQYAGTGTTSWTTLCTITVSPFSCRYDTARIVDGSYSFRAIAIDFAGNTTTSAAVTNRLIDNTVSSVSMEDPGEFLAGTVPLTANAASTAGVASVRIQMAPNGSSSWSTLCSVAASPYTCNWNSATVANGVYDFRAILVDGASRETISTVVASRRVDNTPLRGIDVQALNGSTTPGRMEAGDTLTLTYSQQVNLATITPGWNGNALPVTVRAQDGNLLGLGSAGDTVDVLRTGSTVNLGSVNLRKNYIRNNRTVNFNSTMTASTVSVNGVQRTVITITLGATSSGNLRTVSTGGSMVWTPNGAVTDPLGNRTSTAPATETGVLDRDF